MIVRLKPRVLLIKQELQLHPAEYMGMSAQQIAEKLNEVGSVPNPAPQRTVPKRISAATLLNLVKPSEARSIYTCGRLSEDIATAASNNDRASMKELLSIVKDIFTPASLVAVVALLNETELDPEWKPTLTVKSRARQIGLIHVTVRDVILAQELIVRES